MSNTSPVEAGGPSVTVLVVDDAEELLRFCELHLGLLGYRVLTAVSADQALEVLRGPSPGPDAVILDQMLPHRDGLSLLPEIRQLVPDAPVIMLTGHGSVRLAVEFMRRGGTDFVEKPVDPEVLGLKLARALRERACRRQRDAAEAGRRNAEALAEQKSEFLGNLGHELRTPVTVLTQMLDLLGQRIAPELGPEDRQALERVQANAEVLAELVTEMTDLEAMRDGRFSYRFRPLRLADLLAAAAADYRVRLAAEGRGRAPLVCGSFPEAVVTGDGARLSIILANLLDNAGRYADPGSSIGLQAERRSGDLAVTVTNTGPTIPDADLEAIFEPFRPTDAADDGQAGGMGLALSRRIAQAHGGQLYARSADRRTRFTLTLPLAGATGAPA